MKKNAAAFLYILIYIAKGNLFAIFCFFAESRSRKAVGLLRELFIRSDDDDGGDNRR